jgi:hypothetical protein
MWPHGRIVWWDAKRALAMRGRRFAVAIALTTAAGAVLGICDPYGSRLSVPNPPDRPPAIETPAVEPTIAWPLRSQP